MLESLSWIFPHHTSRTALSLSPLLHTCAHRHSSPHIHTATLCLPPHWEAGFSLNAVNATVVCSSTVLVQYYILLVYIAVTVNHGRKLDSSNISKITLMIINSTWLGACFTIRGYRVWRCESLPGRNALRKVALLVIKLRRSCGIMGHLRSSPSRISQAFLACSWLLWPKKPDFCGRYNTCCDVFRCIFAVNIFFTLYFIWDLYTVCHVNKQARVHQIVIYTTLMLPLTMLM